jgi:hypothetical protein
VLGQGFCLRKKRSLTGGATPSARRGGQHRTFLGRVGTGPWAAFRLGPIGSPAAFYPFFVYFFFLFSDFLFVSKVKLFKTTSNQFKHKTYSFSKIQSNLLKQ